MTTTLETKTRLLSSSRNWMDAEALRQFCESARLDGARLAVGLPNLHAGKTHPGGAAFVTEGVVYPQLVGADIGCGLGLWKTDLSPRDVQLDNWAARAFDLEGPGEGDVQARLAEEDLPSTAFDKEFGTLGGASHFAELQAVEKVHDVPRFADLGLSKGQLVLLVHSGSQGLGVSALRDFVREHGTDGAPAYSHAAGDYFDRHDVAVRWAQASRALLAERFLDTLGGHGEPVLDVGHNSLTSAQLDGESVWLHRRGAAPADEGPIVIAGTRGSLSYLVQPFGDDGEHAWSLPSGAGRKWARGQSRARVRGRFSAMELAETPLGSHVVCANRDLLYEEAPMAFKDVARVVEDLVDAGLISVIATLRPVLTYKTRTAWP
jgi:release factor H-coupled RctB family protein